MGTERISYKRVKEVKKESDGPLITNGRDSGGNFWIVGINKNGERKSDIPKLSCFGMSIEEDNVKEYLYDFLLKYFDRSVQERDEYDREGFDFYGVNLYTFETMRKMLDDIYKTMKTNPKGLHFYERFCARMESMLKIPGDDMISFAGP